MPTQLPLLEKLTQKMNAPDEVVAQFVSMFGDTIPDPIHEPRRFAFYKRLFEYEIACKTREKEKQCPGPITEST